jgi:hypothetical protein
MSQSVSIIIVEKNGVLKPLTIKDFKEEELYKKCGFKKPDQFIKQTQWTSKYDGKKYIIQVFAKSDGRANSENKYDFPPPIDTKLFFGNCAIVASLNNENGTNVYIDLSIPLWAKIYEKLFGGFEDLTLTTGDDDEEEDELANVPKDKKTKHGYLKDGFVVDSDGSEDDDGDDIVSEDETEDDDGVNEPEEDDCDVVIEDIGSELSEESYDYESDSNEK